MYVFKKASGFRCILCNTYRLKYSCTTVRKFLKNGDPVHEKDESAKMIKRYNRENKILFGELAETARQKIKNKSKLVNESIYSTNKEYNASEGWWCRNHSQMQILRPALQSEASSSSSKHNQVDNLLGDYEFVPKSTVVSIGSGQLRSEIPHRNINLNTSEEKVSSIIFHKSNLRLPPIMVKNITTFPLINEKKQSCDNTADSSSILNIPLKEPNDSAKNNHSQYPSVSKILNATLSESSQAALQKWKAKMTMELGEEGFQIYQKALLDHGKKFHSTIQRFLSGIPQEEILVDPAIEDCWHSLAATLKDITDVKVLESHVVHKELLYHGIIDCVALYKGKPLLIEWKKSNKQKSAIRYTYDAPLQLAAYLGAMNFDSNYNIKAQGGLVVVAYTDGSPAHVHHMNLSECQKYWHLWLERLQLYWELFNKQETMNNVPDSL